MSITTGRVDRGIVDGGLMRCRILLALLAIAGVAQIARADSPSVTAVLSNSEATVGDTVELQSKVTGPGDARPPEEISVDGLEIHSTGTSRQFEIHNFSTSSSVTYNYTILPLKAGRFTIPAQTVLAGGKILRTPELSFNVADAPNQQTTTQPGRSAQGTQRTQSHSTNARDLVFAELIIPKKAAYVGEIVPVQIRMGFDARVQPRLTEPPDITGQGFTAQKLQQSSQNLETINGRPFDVVTFKTAITAARTRHISSSGNDHLGLCFDLPDFKFPRSRCGDRSFKRHYVERSAINCFQILRGLLQFLGGKALPGDVRRLGKPGLNTRVKTHPNLHGNNLPHICGLLRYDQFRENQVTRIRGVTLSPLSPLSATSRLRRRLLIGRIRDV